MIRSGAAHCLSIAAMIAFGLAAPWLPAATPLAQEHVVVLHNPDPEYYVEGPGLARMEDGALVAVVPVVPREQWSKERRATRSVTHILRSQDGGRTWARQSELPYYSAVPWTRKGSLYLFCNKGGVEWRNDDVVLLRSDDSGKTWSEPVTLFQGHYWNCHTGMVQHADRLYWATDDLALGSRRGPCLIAGDLSGDIMNPASWRISKPVPFPGAPKEFWHPKYASSSDQYLEPNVIEVNGRLRVLATVKFKRQTSASLSAVFDARDQGGALDLKFVQYNAMPGGQLKFCVVRDEPSKLFWATSNLAADSQDAMGWQAAAEKAGRFRAGAGDRRFLMLHYSVDGLNWFPAGCVARAEKMSQSFMYARPVVDGDDLAIIVRSSQNGPHQHDADTATFHRVKNFRQLAMDLSPQPE